MDFGLVDFGATHDGYVRLGTNGSITLSAGASGLDLDGTAAAGEISVSGDDQSTVSISCNSSGSLSDGEGNTLSLMNVEYAIDSGVAFGDGIPCAGLGNSETSVNLAAIPNPNLLFGGELDLSDSAISESGAYDAAPVMGGTGVTVRIVYQ